MKVNAVDNLRFNNLNFEGKKDKNIQKPAHTTSPVRAIPVAVLIAMSPLNAQKINAAPLPVQTEATAKTAQKTPRPQNFIEKKYFSGAYNDCLIGLVKDSKSGNYKLWLESLPKDLTVSNVFGLQGYVAEFNNNTYRITDETGINAALVKFKNLYVYDANGNEERNDGFVDKEVCSYVEEMMKKYQTDIKINNNIYTSTLSTDGTMRRLEHADTKWLKVARENPMDLGTSMKSWEIATSNGKYTVSIYNTDKNGSDFEKVSIQHERGPLLKVDEIVANNTYIHAQQDMAAYMEMYQINVSHDVAGKHTLANKELWEFLSQIFSAIQNNNAISGRRADIYHVYMLPEGVIGRGNY